MGMRTMLYTVAEDIHGRITVNGYYSGWGVGRVMPLAVMSMVINCFRNEDIRWSDERHFADALQFDYKAQRFCLEFTDIFPDGDQEIRQIWDTPSMIGTITQQFDNNNGACILYAKQVPVPESKSGKEMEPRFRLGFLHGYSDEYDKDCPDPYAEHIGKAFSRWLTLEEWAALESNRDWTDEKFLSWFRGFLDEFEIEIMKPQAKKAAKKKAA